VLVLNFLRQGEDTYFSSKRSCMDLPGVLRVRLSCFCCCISLSASKTSSNATTGVASSRLTNVSAILYPGIRGTGARFCGASRLGVEEQSESESLSFELQVSQLRTDLPRYHKGAGQFELMSYIP
jgi:hypothetical protein